MERTLKKACGLGLGLVLVVAFTIRVCAQKNSPPPNAAPLVLTGAIPLPNVKGALITLGSIRCTTGFLFPRWEVTRKRLLESVPRQWCIRFLEYRPRKALCIRPRLTSCLLEATRESCTSTMAPHSIRSHPLTLGMA